MVISRKLNAGIKGIQFTFLYLFSMFLDEEYLLRLEDALT